MRDGKVVKDYGDVGHLGRFFNEILVANAFEI